MEKISRRRTAAGRLHSSTRELVLRAIEARATRGASTAELSEATGLHENTVRGHLDRLLADGHVRRTRDETVDRGRPPWRWQSVAPHRLNPYAGLAASLADALTQSAADPQAQARAAGASWGEQLAAEHPTDTDARTLIVDVMREQGFAPEDDGTTVRLHTCPLLAAAVRNPATVCAVHEGIIDGIARAAGSDLTGTLLPFADVTSCILRLQPAGER